jgi:hypothetical protein
VARDCDATPGCGFRTPSVSRIRADLWQVYLRQGSDEYKDPVEFYRRTFITEGLLKLLANALQRLAGRGGDPIIELQTNFGGGKTHSLLALWHLFAGVPAGQLPGLETVTKIGGRFPTNQGPASGAGGQPSVPGRYSYEAGRNGGTNTVGRARVATGRQRGLYDGAQRGRESRQPSRLAATALQQVLAMSGWPLRGSSTTSRTCPPATLMRISLLRRR